MSSDLVLIATASDQIDRVFTNSEFLRDFHHISAENICGFIVLEHPDLVKTAVTKHTARDSTIRQTDMWPRSRA